MDKEQHPNGYAVPLHRSLTQPIFWGGVPRNLLLLEVLVGIIGGIGYQQIVASITKGFGGTLGSIGIIIGFGVMMGQLFEVSGAAKRMALSFLKLFGKGREEIGHGHHGLPRLDPDLLRFRLHHPDAAGQGNLL